MRNFVVIILTLLALSVKMSAQTPLIDHWKTPAECQAAVGAPFYYPSILSDRKLGPDEVIRGHPTGGCFDLDLPDRLGGRGWVRIEPGRPFVYNTKTGEAVALGACKNKDHGMVPFLPFALAKDGINGRDGKNGRDGIDGAPGSEGPRGFTGERGQDGRNGFCSSAKCKWLVAGAIAGTTTAVLLGRHGTEVNVTVTVNSGNLPPNGCTLNRDRTNCGG